jgi:hypothetical protein
MRGKGTSDKSITKISATPFIKKCCMFPSLLLSTELTHSKKACRVNKNVTAL